MNTPSFIISLRNDSTKREVKFRELYSLRDQIDTLTIMWDFNSYYINVNERYMVINGGRQIRIDNLSRMKDPELYYRRRHTSTVSVAGGDVKRTKVAYILGAEGVVDTVKKRVYVIIESEGSEAKLVDNEIAR